MPLRSVNNESQKKVPTIMLDILKNLIIIGEKFGYKGAI